VGKLDKKKTEVACREEQLPGLIGGECNFWKARARGERKNPRREVSRRGGEEFLFGETKSTPSSGGWGKGPPTSLEAWNRSWEEK